MAKGATAARTPIGLKCPRCGKMTRRHTEKNTKNTTDKLAINKYCPKCRSVQTFTEAKIGK